MNLINLLAEIREKTDETPTERATRIQTTAAAYPTNAHTLLDVEQGTEHLVSQVVAANAEDAEKLPAQVDPEMFARLAGIILSENLPQSAGAIMALHTLYEDAGVFNDLGITRPDPGALRPPVDTEADADADPDPDA